jgi:hypothetical protein
MLEKCGGFERVDEQWVGCVEAEVGREGDAICFGGGQRVPVAGLLLILCTVHTAAMRNKVR